MSAIERHRQAVLQRTGGKPAPVAETNTAQDDDDLADTTLSAIERHTIGMAQCVQSAEKPPVKTTLAREYDVLKQLALSDYQRLKNKPDDGDHLRKDKAKLINHYREYLTEWMAAGEKHNNDVLFLNIVWVADVGEWDWLMTLTDYAVQTGQTTEIFKSTPENVAAREIYYFSKRQNEAEQPIPDCFYSAFERIKTGKWTVSQSVKARFYKLAGIDAQAKGELALAKDHYTTADSIDEKVGVKTLLKALLKNEAD